MIDMTNYMMNSINNLNIENERISHQLSTGKALENGSEDSVLYARLLDIEDDMRVYGGLKTQIEKTTAQNTVADTAIGEVKSAIDLIKIDLMKSLNAGMDESSIQAVATNIEGIRENLLTLSNTTTNGEYLFSGSDTTKVAYTKDDSFALNGKINFGGDAILRKVAVEPNTYRDRGITSFDIFMYNSDTAGSGDKLTFEQTERIIDENDLEWNLNKATTGNKLVFSKDEVIRDDNNDQWVLNESTLKLVNQVDNSVTLDVVLLKGNKYQTVSVSGTQGDGTTTLGFLGIDNDADGDVESDDLLIRAFDSSGRLVGDSAKIKVTETTGTPNKYETTSSVETNSDNSTNNTRFLEVKHNYFDDLNKMINTIRGYSTNEDGTKGSEKLSDGARDTLLRSALDATTTQYNASNIGHAELGGRNNIFNISLE